MRAPSISRVHRLFRLRTVVTDLINEFPDGGMDSDIGRILVDRKLSNISTINTNSQLRRARDHALNCCYLGLLTREKRERKFYYFPTPVGKHLGILNFNDAFPKDSFEVSIFSDRLLRLKLTNPYDSKNTYEDYRCRPLLNILRILRAVSPISIEQFYYVLSQKKDLILYPNLEKRIIKDFKDYNPLNEDDREKFVKDHDLDTTNLMDEISRTGKPIVEWCRQVSLINYIDGLIRITEQGAVCTNIYSNFIPLWYNDFNDDKIDIAAFMITLNLCRLSSQNIPTKKLTMVERKILKDLRHKKLISPHKNTLKHIIDFDLFYDIPEKYRKEIKDKYDYYKTHFDLQSFGITLSEEVINDLDKQLSNTKPERDLIKLNQALGFSIPRKESFQNDFEWEVCIKLLINGFNAGPYQGTLEGYSSLPMSSYNPDVLIQNSIYSLVECKSTNEWSEPLRLRKAILGEIMSYQKYASQVETNSKIPTSVLFVYGGSRIDNNDFINPFISQEDDFTKISIATSGYLEKLRQNHKELNLFRKMIEDPSSHPIDNRILQ